MPAVVVVGGQYGGEGKGKIISYLSLKDSPKFVVRGSGPNAGHHVTHNTVNHTFRMLPSAAIAENVSLAIGPGALINAKILSEEIDLFSCHDRVLIDFRAGVINNSHISSQHNDERYSKIGTTYQGTGFASADRCLRKLQQAKEIASLSRYLANIPDTLLNAIELGNLVIAEGSQSYWLSNYYGDYPYTTSRDTTAAAVCSEVGIGIKHVKEIILVVKAFPTRNHCGILPNELINEQIDKLQLSQYNVNGIKRRVGQFDINTVAIAARHNSATSIALTSVDLLNKKCTCATSYNSLTKDVLSLIDAIEQSANIPVTIISTGPESLSVVDRR